MPGGKKAITKIMEGHEDTDGVQGRVHLCSGNTFQESWPLVRGMKEVREWATRTLWAGCSRRREEWASEVGGIAAVQLDGTQVLLATTVLVWALPGRQAARWCAPPWAHSGDQTDETREHHTVSLWGNWFSSRTGFSIITHPPSLTCSDLSAHGMLSWGPNDLLRWAALSAVWSGVTILFQLLKCASGIVTTRGSAKRGTLKITRAKLGGRFNLESWL